MKTENKILEMSFDFSLQIISLYKLLIDKKEFVLSKQVLRSGTIIGANVEEAVGAFTKKEFVYKMSLAFKEARESKYWILLLEKSDITFIDVTEYLLEIENIINILTKIIKTTRTNLELGS